MRKGNCSPRFSYNKKLDPLVPDAHYSERQDGTIFFTNSTIKSRFKVRLRIFIFCTLGTNGLVLKSKLTLPSLFFFYIYNFWFKLKKVCSYNNFFIQNISFIFYSTHGASALFFKSFVRLLKAKKLCSFVLMKT